MALNVVFEVVEGSAKGRRIVFDQYGVCVVGRNDGCAFQLPEEDEGASRYHFIIEANPPDVHLRDLGSMNGTHVNGVRHGGRGEEDAATDLQRAPRHPEVVLHHGDKVKAGATVFEMRIESTTPCARCAKPVVLLGASAVARRERQLFCEACEPLLGTARLDLRNQPSVRCARCGTEAAGECGGKTGSYLCRSCVETSEADPVLGLTALMRQTGLLAGQKEGVVAGYKIVSKIGSGSNGTVYLARRLADGREVALKVMLAKVAVDEDGQKYFMREIKILSRLVHKNIVALLEAGSAGNGFYFAMEYCALGSVELLLKEKGGRLTVGEAAPLVVGILEGLSHAHGRNIVHRDINPGNILLARTGEGVVAKLADFGLSKNFARAGFSGFTLTGVVGGTLSYMPREQLLDFRMAKPCCDVWSVGASFYKMLTGATPLNFDTGVDPLTVVTRYELVPVRRRGVTLPARIAAVIDTALAPEPSDRFPHAGQMLEALRSAL